MLAVGAGGGCLDIFLSSIILFLSPSLWETARYRQKYCLKGPLSPKQPTNKGSNPTNRLIILKTLLQNHLPQMLEIWYVALPSRGGRVMRWC